MYYQLKQIIKKIIPKALFDHTVNYYHLLEAVISNISYGFPARNLKVIGITGTNGKTTTTFMVHKMLVNAGINTGVMSTVAYGVNDDIHPQMQHMTTVSTGKLMKRIKSMKQQGIEWLVLEVTSQALVQNRLWGVPFSVAVFTNLTHEHLDYHKTFENYRNAKRKLFKLTNENEKGLQTGIINADDASFEYFASDIKRPILYGIENGKVKASDLKLTTNGSTYNIKFTDEIYKIVCNIPGSFNVANSLAAVCVGRAIGLNKSQIEQGIAALKTVEGRMAKISEGQDFDVIVDFAHTPDSFEKLFKDIKPVVKGKLIVMFGSAGRRDETKRAVQGGLAGKYADLVVVTEEDDRDADGQKIMQQIAEGAEKSGKVIDRDLFLVHDRTEAIAFTLKHAQADDTVLLLGKGHEKTIERANGENSWDEVGTTKKLLKNL